MWTLLNLGLKEGNMRALRYRRLKKRDPNPSVYRSKVSGPDANQLHQITKFMNRKTSPGQREFNRIFKALTKIEEYQEEFAGKPNYRRQKKLLKKIEAEKIVLQKTSIKPAEIGANLRHRRLDMWLTLYFNRHGEPKNIKKLFRHLLLKTDVLDNRRPDKSSNAFIMGEQQFRAYLKKNWKIIGKPGRRP